MKAEWSHKCHSRGITVILYSPLVCVCAQSSLTVCNPMDCSLPGSSIHGLFQGRILEWVAMPSSRGSSWPRARTLSSCVSLAGEFFTTSTTWEACIALWALQINLRPTQRTLPYWKTPRLRRLLQSTKTAGQVLIRSPIQRNVVLIPKSMTQTCIVENFQALSFTLNNESDHTQLQQKLEALHHEPSVPFGGFSLQCRILQLNLPHKLPSKCSVLTEVALSPPESSFSWASLRS